MRVEIREYLSEKPNGDRATKLTPSSLFVVVIVNPDKTGRTEAEVARFDQFDSWHCHVENYQRTRAEAQKCADRIAQVLACGWTSRRFRSKVVQEQKWEEVDA